MVKNYAFIDSQNLNLAIRDQGWKLDFRRFRIYLKDKYSVSHAFLFLGYIYENQKLYDYLQDCGYVLVFKPTLRRKGLTKGNIDTELVLHAMIEYPHYDKAIIVTGDGDFYCLIEYLEQNNKLLHIIIPNQKKYSALLQKFGQYLIYIVDVKKKVMKQKERH